MLKSIDNFPFTVETKDSRKENSSFTERQSQFIKKKNQKLNTLKRANERKELKECTFLP